NELTDSRELPERGIADLELRLDPPDRLEIVRRTPGQPLVVEGDAALALEPGVVEAEGVLHDRAPSRHHLGIRSDAHRGSSSPLVGEGRGGGCNRAFIPFAASSSSGDGSPKSAGLRGSTALSRPLTIRSAWVRT